MKKLLLCSLLFLIVFSTYAKSYEELIKDGEDFENKKQWIYALGAYYDAIQVSEDYEDAEQKYDKLSNCIREGNPGFGEFNIFSMHDEWVNLIKNAEQYFTKTFPYEISYENIEMDSADYESRTANYKLSLKVEESVLYKDVLEILKTGYSKTNHKDWTDLESDNKTLWFNNSGIWTFNTSSWDGTLSSRVNVHRKSVFNTKHEKIEKVTEYPTLQKEAQSIYQKNGVALSYLASMIVPYARSYSYLDGISICEVPAFAACFSETISTWNGHDYNFRFMLPFYVWGEQTCYDLKLGIYDENDSLIIEGKRQTVCTGDFSYQFTKIPQEKLSILDSKKYKIKLLGIWLNYGVYDISLMTDDDIKNKTIRGIVKPLPDIKIQTENVEFIDAVIKRAIEEEQKRKIEKEQAEKETDRLIREKAEWDAFISEMKEKYLKYEERYESATLNMQKEGEKIGVQFSSFADIQKYWNGWPINNIIKPSIASKEKLKVNHRLTKINNINLSEILLVAKENTETYIKLERLITFATELAKNYPYKASDYEKEEYEKEKEEIKREYSCLPEIQDCYIFCCRKEMDYFFIDNLPSGTELTFKVFGELMILEKPIIEIVVP